MTLVAGERLGLYEITCSVGKGGMGEVYRARDIKLGREVAIKVLPDAFAHDSERLARFQREAKILASLNHPNIAAIYGLEEDAGTNYLVMELALGETLAERVRQEGALPWGEALLICKQIAEALEAAHEKGIIHRDLKPSNVKVTPEGKVKVLDFGLAKALGSDAAKDDPSNAPTVSCKAMRQDAISGTPSYMSPEQARCKVVSKCTDIWALGCLLYELLTGRQAFQGQTVEEILAAVRDREPNWCALPETTPKAIRGLLRRCLQKDVNKRVHDAADVRIEIDEILVPPMSPKLTVKIPRWTAWRGPLLLATACLVVGAFVGIVVWNLKPPAPAPSTPVSRSVFYLPPGQRFPSLDQLVLALSPDGKQLVYVASTGGAQQLFLRSMDGFDARPVPGTEGAAGPFFSPDGQWIGFFAEGKLKKISVSGGVAVTLCRAPAPLGGTWAPNERIVFATSESGLSQVSALGGTPQPLTTLDSKKAEYSHSWPEFLPGANAVLFSTMNGLKDPTSLVLGLALYGLNTAQRRDLIQVGTRPSYAPTGHLLYAQGGTLMAVPFDAQRLQMTGDSAPIVERVMQSGTNEVAQYSVSSNGTLAYISSIQAPHGRLVSVDRKGGSQPVPASPHAYVFPRISPDGRHLAVNVKEGIEELETQIWIYDVDRETLNRLTFEGSPNTDPVWTPDGKRVAYGLGGPQSFFWQAADGSGKAERLTTNGSNQVVPSSWSADAQEMAFAPPDNPSDVWIFHLSDRKAQPFLRTQLSQAAQRFSPDGRWLAYQSDDSGRSEVYVQPYARAGGKRQISTEGATEPVWNPNGRELFYRSRDKMIAVDIMTEPAFSVGKPRVLFEKHYMPAPGPFPNYDVYPDGRRFLMVKADEQEETATQINVVLNWFEELKQKVPAGRK